jgi:hypothetical protein
MGQRDGARAVGFQMTAAQGDNPHLHDPGR